MPSKKRMILISKFLLIYFYYVTVILYILISVHNLYLLKGEIMTLHEAMCGMLAKAADGNLHVFMRDAYAIMAKKCQTLIEKKGPNFPVNQITSQEIADVKSINIYV